MGSTGVDQESHLATDQSFTNHHQNTAANHNVNDGWGDMNAYHQSAMPDYGFSYSSHTPHGLPSESIGRMPPPPAPLQPILPPQQQQQQQQHRSHTQLAMLTIPQGAWPSNFVQNRSSYSAQSAPPLQMPPVLGVSPSSKPIRPLGMQQSAPRKTLTDDDRRRMCQYHMDNPNMKQTEIGAMFGVERSTVSKVLRNKEKYLFPEDRTQSPVKRNQKKLPDFEKALSSWVNKRKTRYGSDISDEEILQQARHFRLTVGGESESQFKALLNGSWLEKFKQKNGIGQPRLLRRASETNIIDHAKLSASPSLTHGIMSTTSPTGQPSPLSADRSDEDAHNNGLGFIPYSPDGNTYKHANSHSTTSLNSAFTDAAASSFSGGALSPTGPFTFSPDPNVGSFLAPDQTRQMQVGVGSNFSRPRSQTFPTLDLEYMNAAGTTTEPSTPRFHPSATAPSSALESPVHEMNAAPFGIDNAIASSPHLHHSSSNSSMAGRSTTTPINSGLSSTPVGSSPTSPTQEDARRAADTLLNFIQSNASNGFVDQNEYATVLRLTEKLRIHQQQATKSINVTAIGGLSRIPEGDSEMPPPPTTNQHVEATMSG
ncbi:hypothetical protein ACHAP6_003772 [Verticillium nonalfalfae]